MKIYNTKYGQIIIDWSDWDDWFNFTIGRCGEYRFVLIVWKFGIIIP